MRYQGCTPCCVTWVMGHSCQSAADAASLAGGCGAGGGASEAGCCRAGGNAGSADGRCCAGTASSAHCFAAGALPNGCALLSGLSASADDAESSVFKVGWLLGCSCGAAFLDRRDLRLLGLGVAALRAAPLETAPFIKGMSLICNS
jgi:hypothetical protein